MSWSTELWDQFDTVSSHTAKGIDFLDKLGHFVKDLCVIETEYAGKLRKLAKSYDLKQKDDEKEFTYCRAFGQIMRELTDMAGQREVVAENLTIQIVREVQTISKELRDERKRHLNEGTKYQTVLTTSLNQLDKSKKSYDKAFKESERAHENYQKADKDLNLSRADLKKAQTASLTKERLCESSKTDYAKQLQEANQAQREHYYQFMPKVFQQLQDMDHRRIECAKSLMKLVAIIQKNVMPIIDKCLDGVIGTANSIDSSRDAQVVVDRLKSGMQPPDDIPFEDLSNRSPTTNNCETNSVSPQSRGSSLMYSHSLKSESFRHTFTARGFKRRTKLLGIFGANKNDYSELPPNQKRKKIQAKIDLLNGQINQANGVKDGLLIMRQAYEENAAFGDPKTIESQLRENELNLERLTSELSKHLVLLEEIDAAKTQQAATNSNKTTSNCTSENDASSMSPSIANSNHRASLEPESELSRTNSDNSLRPDSNNCAEGTKSSATNRTSNSFNDSISDSIPESAILENSSKLNTTRTSAPDAVDGHACKQNEHTSPVSGMLTHITNNAQTQETNPEQASGEPAHELPDELAAQAYAKALYPFKAEPTGSISMEESEQFDVIEFDQGDGWTRVRRKVYCSADDDFIGFVPTTYIAIEQIPDKSP